MVKQNSLRSCRDLDAVARLVARQSQYAAAMKALRATREKDQFYLLSAPATVALAVDWIGLEWPTDRPFNLLVLGATRDEFLDRGQWYRFLPAMLGHQGKIAVTVCDDGHATQYQSRVPHVLRQRQSIPVKVTSATVPDLLETDLQKPDLAISYDPLPTTPASLASLQALARHQVPLVFTSWSTTHALVSHALFEVLGAIGEDLCTESPFALPSKRPGEQRNRVISYVPPESLPAPDATIDEELLELLTIPLQVALASHHGGTASMPWRIGQLVTDRLAHTLDGIGVHLDNLEVFDLSTDSPLGRLDEKFREHVVHYDPSVSHSVDRFIWAAHVRYMLAAADIVPLCLEPRSAA